MDHEGVRGDSCCVRKWRRHCRESKERMPPLSNMRRPRWIHSVARIWPRHNMQVLQHSWRTITWLRKLIAETLFDANSDTLWSSDRPCLWVLSQASFVWLISQDNAAFSYIALHTSKSFASPAGRAMQGCKCRKQSLAISKAVHFTIAKRRFPRPPPSRPLLSSAEPPKPTGTDFTGFWAVISL
jgi:hypothetical protein